MKIGSLFSGIGGLELGLCAAIPNAEVMWQAECDPYALAVLAHHWPSVKRYTDVRQIDETAEHVDVICGGFPCQPHSLAGKRKGTSDERWIWPEFARIIEAVKPRVVFIENVPGLRTSGLQNVLADLTELGFDAEWDVFRASETGAPHIRKRIFLLSYSNGISVWNEPRWGTGKGGRFSPIIGNNGNTRQTRNPWEIESGFCRVADGIPDRSHRLRLLGNSVVPQQAALAFRELMARAF